MVSTFTTARNYEKPAAGDQVGTWGTASINPNYDIIDAGMGQRTTIDGSAGSVVLSAAQFRCAQITINSTLLASITLTFPTSFTGGYTIYHAATGSSAFTITLATTAGGEAIACKPGELFDIFNNGINIRFRNLGHIGSVWEYIGSSVPNWVSGCTVPPYLNADGTTFSSATYPQLAAIMGTTLPDFRGRYRATLNQGTGRIQSSVAGVDGNTNFASGGITVLTSAHIPPVPVVVTDPGHFHANKANNTIARGGSDRSPDDTITNTTFNSCAATTGITVTAGNASPSGFVPPTAMAGLTLIRAG